jgi:hypothetical protein
VKTAVLCLLLLAPLLLASPVRAASTGIAVDRLVPGVGPDTLIGVEGGSVTPFGQGALARSLSLLRDPIRLVLPSGDLLSRPVRDQLVTDLSAEAGLWSDRLAVAVGLPIVYWQDGDRLRGTGASEQKLATTVAGDLRLRVKGCFFGSRRVHVGALVQVTVPLGGQKNFAGNDGVTVEPRLLVDVRLQRVFLAANLGVRFASDRALFQTTFGDELTWSLGGGVRAWSRERKYLELMVEGAGAVGGSPGTRPVELRGAARLGIGAFSVDVGAGAGVDDEVGAPSWRVFMVARALVGRAR